MANVLYVLVACQVDSKDYVTASPRLRPISSRRDFADRTWGDASQKNSRRPQVSISETPCTEDGDKNLGSVDPKVRSRFAFPVAEILNVQHDVKARSLQSGFWPRSLISISLWKFTQKFGRKNSPCISAEAFF